MSPIAAKCVSPCLQCVTVSSCLSCINDQYYLDGNTCISCSTAAITHCDRCTSTGTSPTINIICNRCEIGYVLDPVTPNTCMIQPCTDLNCMVCQSGQPNICITCVNGYGVGDNGWCYTICGDAYLAGWEACDDGNLIQNDGCSNMCFIEN